MAIQVIGKEETAVVAGGLSLTIGDNPILNGSLNLTPGGIFTLAGSLLSGALGLVTGLLAALRGLA